MAILRLTCRRCDLPMEIDDQVPLPPEFPFCSKRCRMVDLGKWFDEEFKLTRAVKDQDIETVD